MGEHRVRPIRDERAAALQGRRAGFVSRVLANTVDVAVLVVLGLAALLGVAVVRELWVGPRFLALPAFPVLSVLVVPAAEVAYLGYFWGTTGRTPGKQLLGLRVVDLAERRLRALRALLRAVLYVLFPLGLLWALVSRKNASLQDLVARTQVVYDWTYRQS